LKKENALQAEGNSFQNKRQSGSFSFPCPSPGTVSPMDQHFQVTLLVTAAMAHMECGPSSENSWVCRSQPAREAWWMSSSTECPASCFLGGKGCGRPHPAASRDPSEMAIAEKRGSLHLGCTDACVYCPGLEELLCSSETHF
jgi:hypothetical protein